MLKWWILLVALLGFSRSQQFFKDTKYKTKVLVENAGLQIEKYALDFPDTKGVVSYIREHLDFKITLLVCGETSAGKSTLINMLLSADLNELVEFSLTGEHQVTNQFVIYEMVHEDHYSMSDNQGNYMIHPKDDRSAFLKELREWEKSMEVKGSIVKVRLPLSTHKGLESDGDPFILIDTPGFDDIQNFQFFQNFLKKSQYTPIAILLQDFMKPTASSYSNFQVISKIKEKAGGNLGVVIFYTKIEKYMKLQRDEAREFLEKEGQIESYAEQKENNHRRQITYELSKLTPMLYLDYDLKLADSIFMKNPKYQLKIKQQDKGNREKTAELIKKFKKEIDRSKNFIIFMYTVKNTYNYLKNLITPIVETKFGKDPSLKIINERLDEQKLFFFLYENVKEAMEETFTSLTSIAYTDPIKLKNDLFSICETILRKKVLEQINLDNIDLQMEKLFTIELKDEKGYGEMLGGLFMSGMEIPAKLMSKFANGEYKERILKPSEEAHEVQKIIEQRILNTRKDIKAQFNRAKKRVQESKEYQLLEIITKLREDLSQTLEMAIFGGF